MISYYNSVYSTYKSYFLKTTFYLLIIILLHELLTVYLEVTHADMHYYYDTAVDYSNNLNVFEILKKIFFFYSNVNINTSLICFFSLLFKINDSILIIHLFNSILFLSIFINLNRILLELNLRKLYFFEFLLLSLYLTFFNIGINKEVIIITLTINLIYDFLLLKNKKTFTLRFILKFTFYLIILTLIKPFHTFLIIPPILFLLMYFFILNRNYYLISILLASFFVILLLITNVIGLYYDGFELIYEKVIENIINVNRVNFYNIGLTNPTLEFLNVSKEKLIFDFFSIHNFKIIFNAIYSSLIFPSINDMYFAIENSSRFLYLIFLESTLIKLGLLFCLIKGFSIKKNPSYFIIFFFVIYISAFISISVPNDGINYRYLYPYKFILIFLGYLLSLDLVKRVNNNW